MSAHGTVKRLLLVDDDPMYLELLTELMQQFRAGVWEVTTASDAGRALTILRGGLINLVMVDARMPVVDGLQLVRLIRQHFPHLRIVILTGYADDSTRKTYLDSGADLFLEKPRSSEGIQTLFITLDNLMESTPETGFRGVFEQMELQDLIQIECSKKNSSRLEVSARGARGEIFIKDGNVIHAQSGDMAGEPALFHLLSLRGGELRVRPYSEPPVASVTNSWMSLLMEWAQMKDETTFIPKPGGRAAPKVEAVSDDAAVAQMLAQPLSNAERHPLPEAVDELFVCSAEGNILHEAGCSQLVLRKRLLDFLSGKAARMGALLSLGRLELVEFKTARHRCAAQPLPEAGVFVAARTMETSEGDGIG